MWGQPSSPVRPAKHGELEMQSTCRMQKLQKSSCPPRVSKGWNTNVMRAKLALTLIALLLTASCSPRDFLTRRLATDLIAASDDFKTPQQYILQTGVLSNKDYASPEFIVLQHHGWISAATAPCTPGMVPPPCWDVLLTPSGVDTIHSILRPEEASKSSLAVPAAKRKLVAVTGISKQESSADVEFTWKWTPLNEIGAALYSSDVQYKSTVGFRQFDDGWRIIESTPHPPQSMSDALKNAEPIP
jgi:hypothetical protein